MPKKLTDDLNERIEAEIARHVEGVSIDVLHATLVEIVSRRTLQRRLANLVDQRRVFVSGKGPVSINIQNLPGINIQKLPVVGTIISC